MCTIVVPLDESELAEQALPWAAYLARGLGCDVRLVTVAERHPGPFEPKSNAVRNESGVSDTRDRDYLERTAQLRLFAGATVGMEVRRGSVTAELRSAVNGPDVKLAILTSHGLGGIERSVVGSTADVLVRTVARPVVVVHSGSPPPPLSSILVAVDGSAAAGRALGNARELGRAVGATISLVSVFDALSRVGLAWPTAGMEGARQGLGERARQHLAETKQDDEEAVVLEGRPVEAIIGYAERRSCEMIVVGSRGRGGLRRLALGSTANAIMRNARRPVMIVR